MVRNEIDIIGHFIAHHLPLVDRIVLADHLSSDGTFEFLLQAARAETDGAPHGRIAGGLQGRAHQHAPAMGTGSLKQGSRDSGRAAVPASSLDFAGCSGNASRTPLIVTACP
jgi:hypothetical protein